MIGVTLASIMNTHVLEEDGLQAFLQNKALRNATPPRMGAAEVLSWLDRRKLLTCLLAPRHPGILDWLDLNGFPTLHIPEMQNPSDLSRISRTQVWVVHHTDDLQNLHGIHLHVESPAHHINVSSWAHLLRFLGALPLDYRQKREKPF
ncbi:hypothetical protein [Deinococcus cellulosilyticus]|uniref:Uncharacterized protein n=1 Tax=Deinococcus cellulosilyticus (strain DSM 18568 / NBRC 106333 / KACC 11606 / 5516J-15) TaxID=1223518 RepID=A0A511N8A3_DEIC1|nr:hypothetical protein [Deinococcus cellulosilyticus]GEM48661.1 hypothetical protein DC3_42960 [Deinococcus cellulosilyticus NBRC 106333 = KACC 11606]